MSEKPNIVYGRLLEAAHISGYGFERMTDELEWLLDGDRWQQVGPGYDDVNAFLRSIDLSAFNLGEKKRLHQRIKELQPQASSRAIAAATGAQDRTVRRHISGGTDDPSEPSDNASEQDQSHQDGTIAPPFDRGSGAVADLSRQATKRQEAEQRREEARDVNRALIDGVEVPTGSPTTIVIDPPWDWGDEGDVDQHGRARPTYNTEPLDKIAELPIEELAQPAAHLYLWITNRSLPKGFALLQGWGFRYVTCLTWVKPNYGMGNYFRGQTEQVLFGVRGSLPLLRRDVGTVLTAPRGDEHSAKPDEFYQLVESCSPGPWMEFYARCQRPGWLKAHGAEVA